MSWWSEFKQHYLVKFWSPIPAVIALGILSTYYFGLLGTFWAVTGEFTRWGGHLAQLFGANPAEWTYLKILGFKGTPWDRIDGVMIIGMFAGALAAALWADNVKLRLPSTRIRIFQALLGGIIFFYRLDDHTRGRLIGNLVRYIKHKTTIRKSQGASTRAQGSC